MSPRPVPPHLAELALTYMPDDGRDDFITAVVHGFHDDAQPDLFGPHKNALEPDRTFGYQVGGRWIATCSAYSRNMSVPGGGSVPTAAVTVVTVSPSYRRRGLLTAMMKHQLADVHRRQEPLALLWASESLIYGRYGYGHAAPRLSISGRTRSAGFSPGVDLGSGSAGEVDRDEFLATVRPLHAKLLAQRNGALDRDDGRWEVTVYDPEAWRHGASALRFVLHYSKAGRVDGYATFRIKQGGDDQWPNAEVQVDEIDATGPAAYAALWRFVLDLDLVRSYSRHNAPMDEPLRYLVANPGTVKTNLSDGTYARLVDVPRALEARTYASDIDVVLGVRDSVLSHNNRSFRLQAGPEGASVTPVRGSADVTLDVRELGAIYLDGTRLTTLHNAGLVQQRTDGSVAAISAAFAAPRPPFCPDHF
jgi:predicted acetyltransferase